MKINLGVYTDRTPVEKLPHSLASEIKLRGLCSEDGGKLVSFCGFLSLQESLNVFLPRSIATAELSESGKILLASELMQAIELYGRQSKTAYDSLDEGRESVGLQKLSLNKWLLDNYRRDGLYSRRRAVKTVNSGKPDWRRTVANSTAFPSKNGTPVYLDIMGSKRLSSSDCDVASIHAFVIQSVDLQYSWVLTGKIGEIAQELSDFKSFNMSKKYMLSVLKKELIAVYSDSDILLLNNLIAHIQKESGRQVSGQVIGLRSFHFAWEHMLSKVIAYNVPVNEFLPFPSYKNKNGKFENVPSKGMRTDIAIKHEENNVLAVIDAKYYSAQSKSNAPGWHDMVKQFFYEKAIKSVMPDVKLKNAFVFPGESGPFVSAHLKSKNTEDDFDENFKPIDCYYVNPQEVIRYYISGRKMMDLTNKILGIT